jgi:uncharacterized alkaline shock family protein YloU
LTLAIPLLKEELPVAENPTPTLSQSETTPADPSPAAAGGSDATAGKAPGRRGDGSWSRSLERSGSGGGGGTALASEYGTTSISSSVVAKIAAMSTQEIPGVQAMGKSVTRAFGAIRSKVPGASPATAQGVTVEVGETQAAIDIDIVCYYGQSIVETADAIRQNVIERIEGMTGLEVVEVNISVDDLYIESDGDNQGSRVE